MFKTGEVVEVAGRKIRVESRILGDEQKGVSIGALGDHDVFLQYGAENLDTISLLSNVLPYRVMVEDDLALVDPDTATQPFLDSVWRELDAATQVGAMKELAHTIGVLHQNHLWLHGLLKSELRWCSQSKTLLISAFPRLRMDEHVSVEGPWRDFKILGELAYEGFVGKGYPGGHAMAAWLQDRDKVVSENLMYPGLPQFLAGCVSPYGDLAFSGYSDVEESLAQLGRELVRVRGFRVGQSSTVGNYIFRKNNQDSCGQIHMSSVCGSAKVSVGFFCVADGIGGIEDGERASGLAVQTACEVFARAWSTYGAEALVAAPDYFATAIAKVVGQRLALEGEFEPTHNRGGTTFSGMLIADGRAAVSHVGDSRISLFRNGMLYDLTADHTLANILIRLGEKTADEIDEDDVSQRTISRFLSTSMEVEWDRVDGYHPNLGKQFPEVEEDGVLEVHRGDILVLTSDGAHGEIDEVGLAALIMENMDSPEELAEALTDNALQQIGRDNSTALVVFVDP